MGKGERGMSPRYFKSPCEPTETLFVKRHSAGVFAYVRSRVIVCAVLKRNRVTHEPVSAVLPLSCQDIREKEREGSGRETLVSFRVNVFLSLCFKFNMILLYFNRILILVILGKISILRKVTMSNVTININNVNKKCTYHKNI